MRVAVAVAATDLTPHAVSAPFARERSSELSLLDRFVEVSCPTSSGCVCASAPSVLSAAVRVSMFEGLLYRAPRSLTWLCHDYIVLEWTIAFLYLTCLVKSVFLNEDPDFACLRFIRGRAIQTVTRLWPRPARPRCVRRRQWLCSCKQRLRPFGNNEPCPWTTTLRPLLVTTTQLRA